jgi:hypothetical protein
VLERSRIGETWRSQRLTRSAELAEDALDAVLQRSFPMGASRRRARRSRPTGLQRRDRDHPSQILPGLDFALTRKGTIPGVTEEAPGRQSPAKESARRR